MCSMTRDAVVALELPDPVWRSGRRRPSGCVAFTGPRGGEFLAVRWRDVDFVGSRIRVRTRFAGGQLTTPKSRSVALAWAALADRTASVSRADQCAHRVMRRAPCVRECRESSLRDPGRSSVATVGGLFARSPMEPSVNRATRCVACICCKLRQSVSAPLRSRVFCSPGGAGTADARSDLTWGVAVAVMVWAVVVPGRSPALVPSYVASR